MTNPVSTGIHKFITMEELERMMETNYESVIDYGEEKLHKVFTDALRVHNECYYAGLNQFAYRTPDIMQTYGNQDYNPRVITHYDIPNVHINYTIGLPLGVQTESTYPVNWTREFVERHRVNDMIKFFVDILYADIDDAGARLREAILNPEQSENEDADTNLVMRQLPFLNGDGFTPTTAPDGTKFRSDHSHYTASDGYDATTIRELVHNVAEHGVRGTLMLYINRFHMPRFMDFKGFSPYRDEYRMPCNFAIGKLDDVEVWVKPWISKDYMIAADTGRGLHRPLAYRVPRHGDLRMLPASEKEPLRCIRLLRDLALTPVQRHMMAVLYVGGSQYKY